MRPKSKRNAAHAFDRRCTRSQYARTSKGTFFRRRTRTSPSESLDLNHRKYPSAHVTVFTALVQVAARIIGERPVALYAPGYADPVWFPSMAAISDANVQARVDIGYHFRETGEVSQVVGRAIGDYLVDNYLGPVIHH